MKKTIKIFAVILMVAMLVMLVSSTVSASTPPEMAEQILNGKPVENTEGLTNVAQTIIGIVNIVAVVVAVVILLVLGIKYMMGSASEKAEYKKSMIPYLIGAFIIFAAPTLVNIIVNIAGNFNSAS